MVLPSASKFGQNGAQIMQILVKIHHFGRISVAVGTILSKHPKLELPQRVDHVSTPPEGLKTHIFANIQHFS